MDEHDRIDVTTTTRRVLQVRQGRQELGSDRLVVEAPLELRMERTALAVLMRTPGHDAELALGFALTEGIVLGPDEMADVRRVDGDAEGNRWELVLADEVTVDPGQFQRNLYTTSSCGVCGKASIDAVRVAARPLPTGPLIPRHVLFSLPVRMRDAQATFEVTGGLHAAALFDSAGELFVLREDVGRHNAVDKVIGARARQGWPLGELVLMVSGRVSFEIAQKAAVAGIPVVCGVSSASSLAVEVGDEVGMTVVGFLRGDGFNCYVGGQRIGD